MTEPKARSFERHSTTIITALILAATVGMGKMMLDNAFTQVKIQAQIAEISRSVIALNVKLEKISSERYTQDDAEEDFDTVWARITKIEKTLDRVDREQALRASRISTLEGKIE